MSWAPISESDSVTVRDLKTVAPALIAARNVLNPKAPKHGPIWTLVDQAESRFQGLAFMRGREKEEP